MSALGASLRARSIAADDHAHRGIVSQPFGTIHDAIPGQPAV
jgi:hypothetical protein